jgi:hypothetical protein
MALMFLKFEELDKGEKPPRHIWWDSDAMKQWWRHVEAIRKAKYSGKGANEPVDDPRGYSQNDAVKDILPGFRRPD